MPNNQYEWFKGPKGSGQKSDWKGNAKVTWKFTRIFLFFSLFFFSMWGCVQTFTNRTSNIVGQGVEITTDRNRISPQVTNLDITVDKAKNLYGFTATTANVVLYDQNKQVFKDMRTSYNQKFGRTYYLDEALNGGNSVARIHTVTIDKKTTTKDQYLYANGNNDKSLLVATSVFDKNKIPPLNIGDYVNQNVLNYLQNFVYATDKYKDHAHYVKITDPKNLTKKTAINKLYIRVADGQIVSKSDKSNTINLNKLAPGTNIINQFIPNDATDSNQISPIDKSVLQVSKQKVDLTKGLGKTGTQLQVTNWNQIYNLNLMSSILANYQSVFNKTPDQMLPTAGDITNASAIKIASENVAAVRLLQEQLFTLAFSLTKGTQSLDYSKSPSDFAKQITFSDKNFAFNNSNHYKPISSWGQAWGMGRGGGPFYGIFVYPIAWLIDKLTQAMPFLHGWESFLSIIFVVIIISLITFLLSFKGTLQQQKMTELNSKKAVIEAKYANYKGNKQMENRKRQEISELYKKGGVNPLSSLSTLFITMPFFLAMWRTIGTNQHIKATVWLGINFAKTSYKELFAGSFVYLPLLIIAGGTNVLSQLYPRWLTKRRDKNRINVHQKEAMKKANKTQNIMMIAFTFVTLIFSAGLQIYFIVRSLWRVAETSITHKILVKQRQRRIQLRK